jgi:SAM-dependent methyltransferase
MRDTVQSSSYMLDDLAKMSKAENYFAWQGRLVRRELGQRVVEVGCGVGNFTHMLLDREVVVALDIEVECVERLRARYPDQANLHTVVGEVTSSDVLALRSFHADSCVCLNVLEHIEDHHRALERMAAILEPGGVIILLVPAFPSLYGPIDRNLGHYRRYTRDSLRSVAQDSGMQIRKMRYINCVGFFGWWANARILRREVQSELHIKVFDRYVVPALSRAEEYIRPPFGQSLFAVLEKS